MLWNLLKTYLSPYRREIYLVLGLQLVATIAALFGKAIPAGPLAKGTVTANYHGVGKDITERAFDLQDDATSLVVTYTNRPSRVSGGSR